MARFIKSRQKSYGTMPGSLIFIGNQKMEKPEIHMMLYNRENFTEKELANIDEIPLTVPADSVLWINIYGLQDTLLIEKAGEHFSLGSLELEDILNTDQRPKLAENEKNLLFILKVLEYRQDINRVSGDQVSIVLGKNTVVTFQEKRGHHFDPVRERIRNGRGRIRTMDADYLAYSLIDTLVDGYMHIIETLASLIEETENEVLHNSNKPTLEKIYRFKTNIGFLRKTVFPLKEMMYLLNKLETGYIQKKTTKYLTDLNDMVTQANEIIEIYHNITIDYLNIYHSNVAIRTNEIMKVLTIFTSIFIPLTFITGVYGTNFDFLPELHIKYAYLVMWGIMVAIAIVMLLFFRRRKWL
jgi:magnesium transporter